MGIINQVQIRGISILRTANRSLIIDSFFVKFLFWGLSKSMNIRNRLHSICNMLLVSVLFKNFYLVISMSVVPYTIHSVCVGAWLHVRVGLWSNFRFVRISCFLKTPLCSFAKQKLLGNLCTIVPHSPLWGLLIQEETAEVLTSAGAAVK